MQEETQDGLVVMPDKPVKLHAMGQGRRSALQIQLPIAVEVLLLRNCENWAKVTKVKNSLYLRDCLEPARTFSGGR